MPVTPGIYIEENVFPGSAVAVQTAIPVFIGYTEKAESSGQSLLRQPTRISSLQEFHHLFGRDFHRTFNIIPARPGSREEVVLLNGINMQVSVNEDQEFFLYRCMRLFYANGGLNCLILSVGTYQEQPEGAASNLDDFLGSDSKSSVFSILEKEAEPTLVLLPDLVAKGIAAYLVYQQVLEHCARMQSRFAILDVFQSDNPQAAEDVADFREGIGSNFLSYGAAYYPWLKTVLTSESEIDFTNLDPAVMLETLLPEAAAIQLITEKNMLDVASLAGKKSIIHQTLMACSPTYASVMHAIQSARNLLPPSAAIAGIYTQVDITRGVWKAPANISVAAVTAPALSFSSEQQEQFNIDALSGKSINLIRSFPGAGTLVWGCRTLDGNSQDWRFINTRRTMIMIEQSLKLACRAFIFEPNHAGTWTAVRSMMENFLTGLWKQGGLQGSVPNDAFHVQLGPGTTMTEVDVLEGRMRVNILVAIVRPAEFVEITLEQQQAVS